MEMVASHGIIPWLEPLTPVPGSSWEDRTPLTAEEMFPLYEQCVRIIEKEGLDLEQTKAGCVKVGVYCALKDVQRYGTT
jgi:hypothetical protein